MNNKHELLSDTKVSIEVKHNGVASLHNYTVRPRRLSYRYLHGFMSVEISEKIWFDGYINDSAYEILRSSSCVPTSGEQLDAICAGIEKVLLSNKIVSSVIYMDDNYGGLAGYYALFMVMIA